MSAQIGVTEEKNVRKTSVDIKKTENDKLKTKNLFVPLQFKLLCCCRAQRKHLIIKYLI